LNKRSTSGSTTIIDFKTHYKITVTETVWYWHKNRYMDQWNRIETLEINLLIYSQPLFNKVQKNMLWRKDSLFVNLLRKLERKKQWNRSLI
jgi:hypothetical protein